MDRDKLFDQISSNNLSDWLSFVVAVTAVDVVVIVSNGDFNGVDADI